MGVDIINIYIHLTLGRVNIAKFKSKNVMFAINKSYYLQNNLTLNKLNLISLLHYCVYDRVCTIG